MADSGGSNLDDAAAKLQAKADEVLKETGSDEEAAKAGGKTEATRNMAKIVKEHAEKGFGDSKEFLQNVMGKISAYTTEVSSSTTSKYQDAKARGLSSADAAKEVASAHYSTAKGSASVHVANVQTNLNKAIAKGKTQGTAFSTTDRDTSSEDNTESLSFPYSWVAWVVSLCGGKGGTAPSASSGATNKEFSVDSLHNAANALTESLNEGTGGGAGKSSASED